MSKIIFAVIVATIITTSLLYMVYVFAKGAKEDTFPSGGKE